MKNLLAICVVLLLASSSFGAIEFSEDGMAGGESASTLSQPVGPRQNDGGGARVPLFLASNSGGVFSLTGGGLMGGAIGSRNGLGAFGNGSAGGGAGGGGISVPTTPVPPTQGPVVATPEPAGILVWSVLACCGVGLARFRRN